MSFFNSLLSAAVPAGIGFLTGGPAGAVMGGLGGFAGSSRGRNPNPANAAQGYLSQVPQMAERNLTPYMQRGQAAEGTAQGMYRNMQNLYENIPDLYQNMPDLYENPNANYNDATTQYGNMTNNPMEFVNEIMRGYEPSRGYNYKENRMKQAMRNSAASGGFAGTQADQEQQAEAVKGMLGEDMQQFLANILGVQSQGASGLERMQGGRERGQERKYLGRERAQERKYSGWERALAQQGQGYENQAARGYDAARAFADLLSGNASERGSLAFQGQRQSNQDNNDRREGRQNFLSNLIGMGMGGFGMGR